MWRTFFCVSVAFGPGICLERWPFVSSFTERCGALEASLVFCGSDYSAFPVCMYVYVYMPMYGTGVNFNVWVECIYT